MIENHIIFTIITVVYNDEKNIEKTINSVTKQHFKQYEYLIIDGASNDKTLDIINKYISKLKLISENDNGIYDAMNKGINLANGKYIFFLNSGDYFYDNYVLTNLNLHLTNQNLDFIYGDCILYNNKFKKYHKSKRFPFIKFGMPFSHQSVFVSTNILKNRPFSLLYKYASDYDFFLYLFYNKCKNYKYIQKPITYYNIEGVSNSITTFKEYLNIIKTHKNSTNFYVLFQKLRLFKFKISLKIKSFFNE